MSAERKGLEFVADFIQAYGCPGDGHPQMCKRKDCTSGECPRVRALVAIVAALPRPGDPYLDRFDLAHLVVDALLGLPVDVRMAALGMTEGGRSWDGSRAAWVEAARD